MADMGSASWDSVIKGQGLHGTVSAAGEAWRLCVDADQRHCGV